MWSESLTALLLMRSGTKGWSLWRCSTVEFQVDLGSWSGHICSSQPKAASLKPVKWFVLAFPGLVQGSEKA